MRVSISMSRFKSGLGYEGRNFFRSSFFTYPHILVLFFEETIYGPMALFCNFFVS